MKKENLLVILLGIVSIVIWALFFGIPEKKQEIEQTSAIHSTGISNLEITFLDIGQGDCAIIKTPEGKYILIDAGSYSGAIISESASSRLVSEIDAGKDIILPYLRKNNITQLEGIIVSHPHIDHYGGLLSKKLVELTTPYATEYGDYYSDYIYDLLKTVDKKYKEFLSILYEIPVKWYADPGLPCSIPEYVTLLTLIKLKKIKYIVPTAGKKLDFGDPTITATVLGPQGSYMLDTPSGVNNSSLVIKVKYKNFSILFTGDIELAAEFDLLELKQELKSTILKVPNHGARTSSSLPFLDYVQPEVAIISCGRGNPFGYPHDETISNLNNLKIKYYRTDLNGTITISTDGIEYTVKSL